MSQSAIKHRLSPLSFLICIRRKLRLPIYPPNTRCTCGHHNHDVFGNHAFCCGKGSKKHTCWSPNWNKPQTDFGTPRFRVLTNPYPNRFGESQNRFGDCFFCVFFFSHAQDQPFFTKQTTTQQQLQLYPFLMRGMRWGAPPSSRRVLTPCRVGAHPARVGTRLRLDAPQQGGNGGDVGLAVGRGGGRGGGQLGDLPAPAGARCHRRRRRLLRCRVDGGVVDACVGGGVSSFRAAN